MPESGEMDSEINLKLKMCMCLFVVCGHICMVSKCMCEIIGEKKACRAFQLNGQKYYTEKWVIHFLFLVIIKVEIFWFVKPRDIKVHC